MNWDYDVFISYSHKDVTWVKGVLLPRLEGAALKVCIDDRDFPIGEVFTNTIVKAVESSRHILIVMTADYFESNWTQYEVSLVLTDDPMGKNQKMIPLLLKPCEIPLSIRRYTFGDFQNPDEKAWENLLNSIYSTDRQPQPAPEPSSPVKNEGLNALTEPALKRAVYSTVSFYRTSFKETSERGYLLSGFKCMHDLFQRMENEYRQLYLCAKLLTDAEASWDDIDRVEPNIEGFIEELNSIACKPPFSAGDFLWVVKLDRAGGKMRSAVENRDASQISTAARRLQEVLNRAPSRINTQLVETAKALPLSSVLQGLSGVRDSLPALEPGSAAERQSKEFGRAVDDLSNLAGKLKNLVKAHDALQEIDDELKRVDALLEQGHDEINEAWNDLNPRLRAVCDGCDADWAVKLVKTGVELEGALASSSPPKIKRAFRTFQSQANRSFNQVDIDLLKVCDELESFNKQISSLLRMTQDV